MFDNLIKLKFGSLGSSNSEEITQAFIVMSTVIQ